MTYETFRTWREVAGAAAGGGRRTGFGAPELR